MQIIIYAPRGEFLKLIVEDKAIGFINRKDLAILGLYNNLFDIENDK